MLMDFVSDFGQGTKEIVLALLYNVWENLGYGN